MSLSWGQFDTAAGHIGGGRIDLDSDTFKAMLTNIAPNLATHEELAALTEISAGNGYMAGGVALTGVTWLFYAAGKYEFDSDYFEWTISGGALPEFQYIVIYSDSSSRKKLLGRYDLGSGIVMPDGSLFRFTPSANGHFRWGQGAIS